MRANPTRLINRPLTSTLVVGAHKRSLQGLWFRTTTVAQQQVSDQLQSSVPHGTQHPVAQQHTGLQQQSVSASAEHRTATGLSTTAEHQTSAQKVSASPLSTTAQQQHQAHVSAATKVWYPLSSTKVEQDSPSPAVTR